MVTMAPMIVQGASASQMALAVGGLLLAHRALQRTSTGLAGLAGAGIALHNVAPFTKAARDEDPPAAPALVLSGTRPPGSERIVAQVNNVTFRYRRWGEDVLRGCSLRIDRGNRFLLEGPSGSGKTTFASVLAGLQTPNSGLVLIDGLDRSVLGAAGWRSRVVMAPQAHDNYLVAGTLAFNLLMGRRWPPEPSDLADAEAVCHELGLGELLRRLPSGLNQIVGETGWQLSQGERTRVFLARALLQRPDLFVLDESFSALDPENVEGAVRCVVDRAPTVLAIAHT
jgi:ATP-binding cassette subfamily B protein